MQNNIAGTWRACVAGVVKLTQVFYYLNPAWSSAYLGKINLNMKYYLKDLSGLENPYSNPNAELLLSISQSREQF